MKMMTSNPKNQFLLGAGFDVLHQESREWLEAIAFWKDETKFFHKLVYGIEPLEKDKQEKREILKDLEDIHSRLYDNFEQAIIRHESFLAKILADKKGYADSAYQTKHLDLKSRFEKLEKEFREWKSIVFKYIESIS